MLNTLVACARNSRVRPSFSGITFVRAMSNSLEEGPMMLLRRASPYWPTGGLTKAAVLNHLGIEGFEIRTDCPGTTFGRKVPFVPPLISSAVLTKRGVNGSPVARVQSPLHCQSPKTARMGVLLFSQRLSWPNGSSHR